MDVGEKVVTLYVNIAVIENVKCLIDVFTGQMSMDHSMTHTHNFTAHIG
jgi:hypothetical protein